MESLLAEGFECPDPELSKAEYIVHPRPPNANTTIYAIPCHAQIILELSSLRLLELT